MQTIVTEITADCDPFTVYEQWRSVKVPFDSGEAWIIARYEQCHWALSHPAIELSLPPVPELPPVEQMQAHAHALIRSLTTRRRQIDFVAEFALPLVKGWSLGADALSQSLLTLLKHPKQHALLLTHISLLPHAIDELLRYDAPLPLVPARTHAALTCAGVTIPAGAALHLVLASANRDPAMYASADMLNILRPRVATHLAFAHSSRLKGALQQVLQVGLQAVLIHWPDLRLALPISALPYTSDPARRSLLALPVWLPKEFMGGD